MAAFGNTSGTAVILASVVGGPSQGRTGEATMCLSTGVKERGEEGNRTVVGGFRTCSGTQQRGKEGGRGVRVWVPHGGWEWERKRGPRCGGGRLRWLASAPDQRARAAALPHDSGGRWGASDVGAAADKWSGVTAGPSGQRLGWKGEAARH
jgi:hypothetical protein